MAPAAQLAELARRRRCPTLPSRLPDMRLLSFFASTLVGLLLALPSLAQDIDQVKAGLRKKFPEAPVDSVRKVPYGNLYEVLSGGEIFYTDDKTSFLLLGALIDTRTKENVTDLRMRLVNAIKFEDLPLEHAIKIVRGNGSRKVAIFEDPNCGYCKRFERDLLGVSDITVYVFLYPILSPDSVEKTKAVWCAPDRGKAWIDLMVNQTNPATGSKCETTAIDKTLAFGREKRIQGTPTIIFENGERVPGAISMAQFERKLDPKSAPAPSAAAKK
jgi:thiol:disulfide interchange protein DsbC